MSVERNRVRSPPPAKLGDGLVQIALPGQQQPQIVKGAESVACSIGPAIIGDRLVEPALSTSASARPSSASPLSARTCQSVPPQRLVVAPKRRLPAAQSHQHGDRQSGAGAEHPAPRGRTGGQPSRPPRPARWRAQCRADTCNDRPSRCQPTLTSPSTGDNMPKYQNQPTKR